MIKRVTKTFTASPSYVSVTSSGTLQFRGSGSSGNRDDGYLFTEYAYDVINITRGYGYRTIDISKIPKGAVIISASLSYGVSGGYNGTSTSYVSLRDYGKSANATNIKAALDSMSSFTTLRLTFSYLLNSGNTFTIYSQYDDESGETFTRSVSFNSIKLTVTYEYEAGDNIYYGNGNKWVQCNAHYGKDGKWIPVSLHSGFDDGWSGT